MPDFGFDLHEQSETVSAAHETKPTNPRRHGCILPMPGGYTWLSCLPVPLPGVPVQLTVDSAMAPFGGPGDPVVQVFSALRYDAAVTSSGSVYTWGFAGNDGSGNDSRGITAPTAAASSIRPPRFRPPSTTA